MNSESRPSGLIHFVGILATDMSPLRGLIDNFDFSTNGSLSTELMSLSANSSTNRSRLWHDPK